MAVETTKGHEETLVAGIHIECDELSEDKQDTDIQVLDNEQCCLEKENIEMKQQMTKSNEEEDSTSCQEDNLDIPIDNEK